MYVCRVACARGQIANVTKLKCTNPCASKDCGRADKQFVFALVFVCTYEYVCLYERCCIVICAETWKHIHSHLFPCVTCYFFFNAYTLNVNICIDFAQLSTSQ